MAETPLVIELTHAVLGLRPYVLVEFTPAGSDEDIRISLSEGGGFDGPDDIRKALATALVAMLPDDVDPADVAALSRLAGFDDDDDQDDDDEPLDELRARPADEQAPEVAP